MFANTKDKLLKKYKDRIREKAISKAKAKIAFSGKYVSDYSKEQLEIIVKEEEDKIYESLKKSGLAAVILSLGLGYF